VEQTRVYEQQPRRLQLSDWIASAPKIDKPSDRKRGEKNRASDFGSSTSAPIPRSNQKQADCGSSDQPGDRQPPQCRKCDRDNGRSSHEPKTADPVDGNPADVDVTRSVLVGHRSLLRCFPRSRSSFIVETGYFII
jgi:hypothetical protein